VAVLLLGAWTPAQEPQPFRAGVDAVSIYATVRGRDGAFVPDLTREDFEIKDNGVRRDIVVFSREIVPITVAVMLDVSYSQETGVLWTRDAGRAFVDALLPMDRARIGTFGREIAISPRLTSDTRYLHRVLDEEVWPGGETPLWSALDRAVTSLHDQSGRRVILALTDGLNSVSGGPHLVSSSFGVVTASGRPPSGTPGEPGYSEVRERLVDEGFMVYAVGRHLPPRQHATVYQLLYDGLSREMRELAVDSGGGFHVLASDVSPEAAMNQVADELHHQYVLGFTPTTMDGKVHKLEVKTKRGGLSVQARKSYRAAP
jgi:VWFA-related protein